MFNVVEHHEIVYVNILIQIGSKYTETWTRSLLTNQLTAVSGKEDKRMGLGRWYKWPSTLQYFILKNKMKINMAKY